MSHHHGLHAVCYQLAAGERILHADVSHGYAVADSDGRNHYGSSSGHSYAGLYGLGNLIKVHVSRHYLAVSRNYGYERSRQLFFRISHGIEEAPHRSSLYAFSNKFTSRFHTYASYFFSQLIIFLSSAPVLHSR